MNRQTSAEAYRKIKEEGLLSLRKMEVYQILYKYGPLTAHEIVSVARSKYPSANQTGFNARLSELKKVGCAIEVGEKVNAISGKKNYLWDVTSSVPIKLEKTVKHKCEHCKGSGYIEVSE